MNSLSDWMDLALARYDDLSAEYAKRKRGLAALNAMDADYGLRYKMENEMYELESEFYSLQSEIEQNVTLWIGTPPPPGETSKK